MSFFRSFFKSLAPKVHAPIGERSPISQVEDAYPGFIDFLLRRFRLLKIDSQISLSELCKTHLLPPALVVLAEFQVTGKMGAIRMISPSEAQRRLSEFEILDIREAWERPYGVIHGARPFTDALLKTISLDWPRQTPILAYCHFGIRSLDAAAILVEKGFENVSVLEGGIDAWAQIDVSVRRYEHAWC